MTCLAMTPDGMRFASGSGDGTVWVWEVANMGQDGVELSRHEGHISSVAINSDGTRVVSRSYEAVRVGNVESKACLRVEEANRWDAMCLFYLEGGESPHEKDMVSYNIDRDSISYCKGQRQEVLAKFDSEITVYNIGRKRNLIVVGCRNGSVSIFNIVVK